MSYALVTGGAKGLGKELCLALARKGYSLLIHYFSNEEAALAIAEECKTLGSGDAFPLFGDFSSFASIEAFLEENKRALSKVDAVVNNVGNYLVKKTSSTSIEEWHAVFQSNLFNPIHLIYKLLPTIKNQGGGSIVNIGVAGLQNEPLPASCERAAYRAAKTALMMATKSFAKELASENISVNMVSPGYLESSRDFPALLPMGRAATHDEVARLILFLLSKENRYITGQNIEIAGGCFL